MTKYYINSAVEIERVATDTYSLDVITSDTERALVGQVEYCPITKKWFFETRPGYMLSHRIMWQIADWMRIQPAPLKEVETNG